MDFLRIAAACLIGITLLSGCNKEKYRDVKTITPEHYARFDEKDAIAFIKGKPTAARTIYVFSRPDCVFCNRFEDEVKKLNDIKVLSFTVVSGKDPTASLNKGCNYQASIGKACDEGALARNNALAKALDVRGTPTVVFPDHQMVAGFMNAGDVEKALGGGA